MGDDIFLRQGSSLTFDVSNTLTISTPIEGDYLTIPVDDSGSLVKTGIGILELNGTNTYVGQTTIEQGTLKLNGSIREDLLIEISGQLSGNATVEGNIYNNGTISPYTSIGTIFTTNLVLSSTSLYTVEIDPTNSNLINVSGTATLGGKVQVIQDPGSYSTQGRYTILTAAGGLSGSINSLEVQGAPPGFQFSLEQDHFNLYLLYVFLPPPENPTITGIQPNAGSNCGGTTITITGTNFTDVTDVLFGSTSASSFTIDSDTSITAVSPPEKSGSVPITIVTPTDIMTSLDQFTYLLPSPPKHLKGKQVVKLRYPMRIDVINILTWKAPSKTCMPVAYCIYRDKALTQLVTVIEGNKCEQLQFKDYDHKKSKNYFYYIVSIDEFGDLSPPAKVVITGKCPVIPSVHQ